MTEDITTCFNYIQRVHLYTSLFDRFPSCTSVQQTYMSRKRIHIIIKTVCYACLYFSKHFISRLSEHWGFFFYRTRTKKKNYKYNNRLYIKAYCIRRLIIFKRVLSDNWGVYTRLIKSKTNKINFRR